MTIKRAVRNFLSEIGKRGGLSTSRAKRIASRRNGRKGGRPRKTLSRG